MNNAIENELVRLTQYSHGAGCGCKIAPNVLEEILAGSLAQPDDENLLVGNHSKDDAAVYDLKNGTALISTTDFFMPIVDDPFDFGQIAAANAISDVYAMGGTPLLAIAILGWPVKLLPVHIAGKVIEGARRICSQAGITLAGGHSIDSPEPIFGLAVSGIVNIANLRQNNTAREGDHIFLTKNVGVGMLTTAEKRGKLREEDKGLARNQMVLLNKSGKEMGNIPEVHAMTDVTGFGLAGHLVEVAEGSGLSAELFFDKIPRITDLRDYIDSKVFPDGTNRNWASYGSKIQINGSIPFEDVFTILADPQTNGGLLITVGTEGLNDFYQLLSAEGLQDFAQPIGRMIKKGEKALYVN